MTRRALVVASTHEAAMSIAATMKLDAYTYIRLQGLEALADIAASGYTLYVEEACRRSRCGLPDALSDWIARGGTVKWISTDPLKPVPVETVGELLERECFLALRCPCGHYANVNLLALPKALHVHELRRRGRCRICKARGRAAVIVGRDWWNLIRKGFEAR